MSVFMLSWEYSPHNLMHAAKRAPKKADRDVVVTSSRLIYPQTSSMGFKCREAGGRAVYLRPLAQVLYLYVLELHRGAKFDDFKS